MWMPEKPPLASSHPDIYTSVYPKRKRDGYYANGHQMRARFTSSATLMIGQNNLNMLSNAKQILISELIVAKMKKKEEEKKWMTFYKA